MHTQKQLKMITYVYGVTQIDQWGYPDHHFGVKFQQWVEGIASQAIKHALIRLLNFF